MMLSSSEKKGFGPDNAQPDSKNVFLELKPMDTLFFREFKPFTSGEDVFARSLLTPPLTAIRGALRAHYFRSNPDKFEKIKDKLNDPIVDPTYYITIKGLYYKIKKRDSSKSDLFLIKPVDIMQLATETEGGMYQKLELQKIDREKIISISIPKGIKKIFLPSKELERKQSEDVLMKIDTFLEYLSLKQKTYDSNNFVNMSEIITPEPKIGIRISEKTKTAEEELFYHIITNRYETEKFEVSFVVEVDLPEDSISIYENAYLKLGGEGKIVRVTTNVSKKDKSKIEQLRNIWDSNRSHTPDLFKIYISTPTPVPYLNKFIEDNKISVQSYLMKDPQLIGGYNIKERKPKPTMKVLSPGTVIVFSYNETSSHVRKTIFDIHKTGRSILTMNKNISKHSELAFVYSDLNPNDGFGRVLLGKENM